MAIISKEELEKVARISSLQLDPQEIVSFTRQVNDVLSYAARVQDIAQEVDIPSNKSVNVLREDVVEDTDREKILHQAPEHEEGYFVVPKIIKSS